MKKGRRILRTANSIWAGCIRDQTDFSYPATNQQGRKHKLWRRARRSGLLKNAGQGYCLSIGKVRSIAVIWTQPYPAFPVGGASARAVTVFAPVFSKVLVINLGRRYSSLSTPRGLPSPQ